MDAVVAVFIFASRVVVPPAILREEALKPEGVIAHFVTGDHDPGGFRAEVPTVDPGFLVNSVPYLGDSGARFIQRRSELGRLYEGDTLSQVGTLERGDEGL